MLKNWSGKDISKEQGTEFETVLAEYLRSPFRVVINLGIEVGQMIAIAVVIPFPWQVRKNGREALIVPEVSCMIAAVGLFLIVYRLWGL